MKELDEIVDLAASDDARLVTILRKCLVVAARLKNDSLRDWATAELNGYGDRGGMPGYRIVGVTAKGYFIGSFGSDIKDQPLPFGALEESHRWWATTAYLQESISAYEAMVSGHDRHGSAIVYWPADMVAYYQSKFFKDYALNRAWQDIPIGAIIAAVDTVRTRLLQLALELQGDVGPDSTAIPSPAMVERTVQTIIYGGTNMVGSVAGSVQLIGQQLVVQGNLVSLDSALTTIGIKPEKVHELLKLIEADRRDGHDKGFGSRVAGWLQKSGTYIGKEGLKAGLEVAQKAATQAVLTYFGLPS